MGLLEVADRSKSSKKKHRDTPLNGTPPLEMLSLLTGGVGSIACSGILRGVLHDYYSSCLLTESVYLNGWEGRCVHGLYNSGVIYNVMVEVV
jgi:hypothetical protein